jgi:hypothetical protein
MSLETPVSVSSSGRHDPRSELRSRARGGPGILPKQSGPHYLSAAGVGYRERRIWRSAGRLLAMVVRKIDDARRLSLFVLVPNDGQPLPNDEESCAAIFDGIWNSLPETGILSRMWRKLRACIKLCGSSHRRSQPRPR